MYVLGCAYLYFRRSILHVVCGLFEYLNTQRLVNNKTIKQKSICIYLLFKTTDFLEQIEKGFICDATFFFFVFIYFI